MNINQEVTLDTKLPFLTVESFHMVWEINQHAKLTITGIAKSGNIDDLDMKDEKQRNLKLILTEHDETIFCGIIESFDIIRESGIAYIKANVVSASIRLDRDVEKRVFQKPSQTYSEIIREINSDAGGKVICTTGNEEVTRPFVCYKETAWQFGQRLASQNQSFLIADVVTGHPNIWLGMRRGKEITEKLTDFIIRIKKDYISETGRARRYYFLESRQSYLLGDWFSFLGKKSMIFKKEAHFERGELVFIYCLAEERDLQTEPYYNEAFTGVSLSGTVKETIKETFRLQFDIDGKSEGYFFPWRPETGNALYAMPEIGAKASLYFPDHDEKNGLGIRCMEQNPEDKKAKNKYIKIPDGAELKLESGSLDIRKNNESATIVDALVAIKGSQMHIQARGKIKLRAKKITLSAASEIRATTE